MLDVVYFLASNCLLSVRAPDSSIMKIVTAVCVVILVQLSTNLPKCNTVHLLLLCKRGDRGYYCILLRSLPVKFNLVSWLSFLHPPPTLWEPIKGQPMANNSTSFFTIAVKHLVHRIFCVHSIDSVVP